MLSKPNQILKGSTALSWATRSRHETVVKMPIDTGKVDVGAQGDREAAVIV